ncbi:sensor histidine kinase [Pseudonocardia sp. TRM90224]|uniref:sensor histidine kinase n=1 Tax=Pseudonocardia sp. TRM90224 TaxID=2812678 RepID=UPI001E4C9285|nr:histidine kinase [Pseudonocardia sp. TRM90224]
MEPRLLPRPLATVVLAVVVAGYGGLAIAGVVVATSSFSEALFGGVIVVALLALQLGYLSRPDLRPSPPWSLVALAAQAVLVFGPILEFGPIWYGFPGLLAGSALIVLPLAAGLPVFVLVVVAISALSLTDSPFADYGSGAVLVYAVTSTVTGGIAVYGLTVLVRLVHDAHAAREQLRRTAVARERVRSARDVHDVLGHCLSEIAMRGALVARLIDQRPAEARAELATLLALSRSALASVRTVMVIRQDLDDGGDPPALPPASELAPRVGRTALVIVLADFTVVAIAFAAATAEPLPVLVFSAARVLLAVLVLVACRRSVQYRLRTRFGLLLLMSALVFLPSLLSPVLPAAAGSNLAAGAVLVMFGFSAVGAATSVLLGVSTVLLASHVPSDELGAAVTYAGIGFVLVTAIVYGLGTIDRLVLEIEGKREQLRSAAVDQERVRFARDVHDLLGLGLSAITLKCDLTGRLLEQAPDRARDELHDVLVTARRSLAEVRSLIGGERELSIEQECLAVEAALRSAEVRVRLVREGSSPTGAPGTVLATVLREGATNVLRHSSAQWCEISLRHAGGRATLEIVNDGAEEPPHVRQDAASGTGLRSVTDRVEALGGLLVAVAEGPVYRLRASVPAETGPDVRRRDGQMRTWTMSPDDDAPAAN